jgi:hypothetical protein
MKILITESQYELLFENNNQPYKNFKNEDHEIYVTILKRLGAPVTPETLGFMYAWRECENSAGAPNNYCNNPFNTIHDMDKDPKIVRGSEQSTMHKRTNSHGVKSYKTIQIGIDATIKTLTNGNYSTLLNALKNSVTKEWNVHEIALNSGNDLKKWGTEADGPKVREKARNYFIKKSVPNPSIIRKSGCE